jgi:ATP-dependent phosphoenolpyruvate carboxykinase
LNIGVEKIKDRSLIPSTLREVLKKKGKFHFYQHSIFPILVPIHMDHVSEKFLMPEKFWKKKHDYKEIALREKKQFAEKLQDVI